MLCKHFEHLLQVDDPFQDEPVTPLNHQDLATAPLAAGGSSAGKSSSEAHQVAHQRVAKGQLSVAR